MVIFGRRSSGSVGADVLALPDLSQLEQIETPGEALLAMHGDQLTTVKPRAPKGSGADIFSPLIRRESLQKARFPARGGRIQIEASGDNYLISYPGDRQLFASTLKHAAAGERERAQRSCADCELLARQERRTRRSRWTTKGDCTSRRSQNRVNRSNSPVRQRDRARRSTTRPSTARATGWLRLSSGRDCGCGI